MSLFFFAALAMIALQFTSAIGQWISESQQATQTVAWMQWLVGKFGLAPTIITTRVIIIVACVVAYELQQHWLVWAMLAASAWYLYKTGKYVVLWAQLKSAAEHAVTGAVTNAVDTAVTDVTKTIVVDTQAAASSAAAAKGVDVSRL